MEQAPLVCAWLQSPRALSCCCALPIKERASPASSGSRISRSLHETLPVLLCFASALLLSLRLPLVLARPQLLLRPLLLCSRLVLCCFRLIFCSASRLGIAASAFDSASAFVSALHSLVVRDCNTNKMKLQCINERISNIVEFS